MMPQSLKMLSQERLTPGLSGVQETMLWSLHDRASEAMRASGRLRDPACVQIYRSIEYDFYGHFGKPTGLSPARAAKMDVILRRWLARYPTGFVVSLGEGLETQAFRVDNGSMTWLTVDLLDAIQFRERFITPTARFRHLAMSALDFAWMEHVDDRTRVFIIAQGLLMYFDRDAVRHLLLAISERFPGAEMLFDVLPHVSTGQSHSVTADWTSPSMPWGLDRDEVAATLRSWLPRLRKVTSLRYRVPSSRPAIIENIFDRVRSHRQRTPSVAHLRF